MSLEFVELNARYGKKIALDGISFSLAPGEVTALLGPNGAGKSTLLSCLLGQKNYDGAVLLDGKDLKTMTPAQRARLIGYLPQELPAPRVTVEELVAFGRAPYLPLTGTLAEADREAVAQALSQVGLEALRDRLVDSLSGGERRKAFLAMVLAQDPRVIALDEPTAHLDGAARFEILGLLKRLCRERGKTLLAVLHDLPEAMTYSQRLVVLQAGRLVFSGTPDQCLARQIPEAVFGLRLTGNAQTGFCVMPKG